MVYDPNREWPFLARAAELDVLIDAVRSGIDDVDAPSGAVVAGAEGVGKTRLAAEVAGWAQRQGITVHHLTGTWATRRRPYAAIAHLVPEVRLADHGDSGALYNEVAIALRQHPRPLLLLNDAHLLDDDSAALVLHLALNRVATVVATIGRGEPVPDPITALWKDALVTRIDLQPLSNLEMQTLISAALGHETDAGTLHRLAKTAAGNALYARELIHGATESGSLKRVDGLWRWDGRVRAGDRLADLVGRRISGLDDDEQRALAAIAVGQPLRLALAERIIDAEVLTRLERAGLVVVADGLLGLEHLLFGDVIFAQRGVFARREVLRSLADAADAHGDRDDDDLLRRVGWRIESGAEPQPEEAVRAARVALASFDAARAAQFAAGVVERAHGPVVEARVVLARALLVQGDFEAAEEQLATVESDVLSSSEAELRREWLDARVVALHQGLGRPEQTLRMLARVEAASNERPADKRLAHALRANLLVDQGRLTEAVQVTSSVIKATETIDYASVIAASSLGEAQALLGLTTKARTTHALLRAYQEAGVPEAQRTGDYAVLQEIMCLVFEGQVDAAAAIAEQVYAALVSGFEHTTVGLAAMVMAQVRLAQGRLADARQHSREATGLLRGANIDGALPWALSVLAQVEALRGDAAAARAARDESRQLHRTPVPARSRLDLVMADIRVIALDGDFKEAARIAWESADPYAPDGIAELAVHRARLLLAAARFGGTALHEIARRLDTLASAVECEIVGLQAAHVHALAAGDGAQLVELVDRLEERGLRLDAAGAASDAARLLVTSDDAAARRMQSRAAQLAAECGGAHALTMAALEVNSRLSPREREVAALAANQLSNAEIAARLVLSVRTVESHLYQAFGKLGVQSRNELGALLTPRRKDQENKGQENKDQ